MAAGAAECLDVGVQEAWSFPSYGSGVRLLVRAAMTGQQLLGRGVWLLAEGYRDYHKRLNTPGTRTQGGSITEVTGNAQLGAACKELELDTGTAITDKRGLRDALDRLEAKGASSNSAAALVRLAQLTEARKDQERTPLVEQGAYLALDELDQHGDQAFPADIFERISFARDPQVSVLLQAACFARALEGSSAHVGALLGSEVESAHLRVLAAATDETGPEGHYRFHTGVFPAGGRHRPERVVAAKDRALEYATERSWSPISTRALNTKDPVVKTAVLSAMEVFRPRGSLANILVSSVRDKMNAGSLARLPFAVGESFAWLAVAKQLEPPRGA